MLSMRIRMVSTARALSTFLRDNRIIIKPHSKMHLVLPPRAGLGYSTPRSVLEEEYDLRLRLARHPNALMQQREDSRYSSLKADLFLFEGGEEERCSFRVAR